MYCLSQAWDYAMKTASSEHDVIIAHALRQGMYHAFNIDVCCDLAVDVSDANPTHENAGNIVMPLDEYMEEQQMEFKIGKFKTYTLKEYNKKGYADYETNGKGIHQFWDLSG